jgi:hypothetical protein
MYYGNVSTTSNREDWQEIVVMTDGDTGDLIDISLCRITLTVRRLERRLNLDQIGDGYYGYGSNVLPVIVLTGSTDTGEIAIIDVGTFQWEFDQSRMSALCQGEYQIGVRISQDTRTMQLIVGTVDVVEGIDTQ